MTEAAVPVSVPQETVNDESVRLVSWKVVSGALIAKDEVMCEIETSKTVVEIVAPIAGILQYQHSAGEEVPVGSTLCSIIPTNPDSSPRATAALNNGNSSVITIDSACDSAPSEQCLSRARLTPLARKAAREHGIDTSRFPDGSLVRKDDVLRMAGLEVPYGGFVPITPRQKRRDVGEPTPDPDRSSRLQTVHTEWRDLPRSKVTEGRVLAAGRARTVQSSVTVRVVAPLLRARATELHSSEVAFDALILFEVGRLLLHYRGLNAVHDSGRIAEYDEINIGWAIDSGSKLVAPVVKRCSVKSLAEIVAVMEQQLERYVDDALKLEDVFGGTFTVSNLSTDGVCFFNPLISEGQSAILGIGSDGSTPDTEALYLTLAFDHQLVEGRTAARFLKELASRLVAHSAVQSWNITTAGGEAQRSGDVHCVVCQRDYAQLQRSRAVLLKSEIPQGLVCSLCVGGF